MMENIISGHITLYVTGDPSHKSCSKHIMHLFMFLGMIEGRRTRGKQRIKYATSLLEDIPGDMRVAGLVQLAQNRREWHSMVAHVEEDMALR